MIVSVDVHPQGVDILAPLYLAFLVGLSSDAFRPSWSIWQFNSVITNSAESVSYIQDKPVQTQDTQFYAGQILNTIHILLNIHYLRP